MAVRLSALLTGRALSPRKISVRGWGYRGAIVRLEGFSVVLTCVDWYPEPRRPSYPRILPRTQRNDDFGINLIRNRLEDKIPHSLVIIIAARFLNPASTQISLIGISFIELNICLLFCKVKPLPTLLPHQKVSIRSTIIYAYNEVWICRLRRARK